MQAIWDAGGNDTIDASDKTKDEKVTIDLRAGHFSFVGSSESTSKSLIAIAFQPTGYEGNWIENATGGAGNDTLIGNGANNILNGGLGADTYLIEDDGSQDTIIDPDTNSKIYIYKKGMMTGNLDPAKDMAKILAVGVFVQESSETNKWIKFENGSKLTLTHNSPWKLVTESGTEILLGDNWQNGDNGIYYLDPATTSTDKTLTGDLATLDTDPNTDGVQSQVDEWGNVKTAPNQIEANHNDTLYDTTGNDRLQGLGGLDILNAFHGGNDILEGGADSDVLIGNSTSGSAGDLLYANTQQALSDVIATGATGAGSGQRGDLLAGGEGHDELYGDVGNDALAGGQGDDVLVGGLGGDVLFGDDMFSSANINWSVEQYHEVVNGVYTHGFHRSNLNYTKADANQGGVDIIYGGAGDDLVFAGAGNDMIEAGADNDAVFGDAGNDVIEGQDGKDILVGDGYGNVPYGNDYLFGGAGNDWLYGTAGDDYLEGGDGNDVLLGDHNDSSSSTDGRDTLNGGTGNDTLYGGGNNDILSGDEGNDQLSGETGDDELDGGTGNDLLLGNEGDDYLNGGSDDDELQGSDGDDILVGGTGIDTLFGENGDDTLWGSEDADTLYGGAGNDYLDGGADDDELQGDEGSDTLDGGAGADTLFGEAGNDTYLNVTGEDTINDTEGHSTIQLAQANGIASAGLIVVNYGDQNQYRRLDIELDDGSSLKIENAFWGMDATLQFAGGTQLDMETLVGTTLTTSLNLQLDNNGGTLYGGAVTDLLYGGSGDDSLSGAGGNDGLYGGAGSDTLSGGTGADELQGGAGNDTLIGGDGNDAYQFNIGDGHDQIIDTTGMDTLVLGANVTATQISVSRVGNEIWLAISVNDSIRFTENAVGSYAIERIAFQDGTVWTAMDIQQTFNHAMPVLNTPATINYIDTSFVDNFVTVTGALVATDTDVETVLTYGITDAGAVDNGTTISKTNTYGTLTVTKATGVYSFVPNSAGIEPLVANTTSSFTVTVSDGFLTVSKPFTIIITQSGITESNGGDALLNGVGVNH